MRRWSLVFAGHIPVITNGWSMPRVAAYERRYAFNVKVLGKLASPDRDYRQYPEMRFKHQCYSITLSR